MSKAHTTHYDFRIGQVVTLDSKHKGTIVGTVIDFRNFTFGQYDPGITVLPDAGYGWMPIHTHPRNVRPFVAPCPPSS